MTTASTLPSMRIPLAKSGAHPASAATGTAAEAVASAFPSIHGVLNV